MQKRTQLRHSTLLHYSLSKIIKKLLEPIKIFELDEVMYQLKDTLLTTFEVDNYILTIELNYNKNSSNILNIIGKEICASTYFELILSNENIDKENATLSLSFMHHNLQFLIDDIQSNKRIKTIPTNITKILDELYFIITKQNFEASIQRDVKYLLEWAEEFNIGDDIIPRSEGELLNLEVLNLANLNLGSIPKQIRVLKNLKKLYLVNNKLDSLPLEIYTLKNLEILWIQDNYLTHLSKEVNNLAKLKELVIYDNNIQTLPNLTNLNHLEFIALHRNRLSVEMIDIFLTQIPPRLDYSIYDQKNSLPFKVEPLTKYTLYETEMLRDKIFSDIEEKEKLLLKASILPNIRKKIFAINEIITSKYWVVRDSVSNEIIGLTGIYTEVLDTKDDCWLGWFCIDDKYRGKGFGKRLLEYSIDLAQEINKKYLHIYAYDIKKHKRAISMYKEYGFKEYNVEDSKYKRDLYFKKTLKDKS